MIIELLENGGLYAYYLNEKCYYVGKTKRDFKTRFSEHLIEDTQEANKTLLKLKDELTFVILVDCSVCHLTISQLDYLETCFIQSLKPILNKRKLETSISYGKISVEKEKQVYFTKKQQIIYETMRACKENKEYITKQNVFSKTSGIAISDKTWRRAVSYFIENNILIEKYTDNNNYKVYELIDKE